VLRVRVLVLSDAGIVGLPVLLLQLVLQLLLLLLPDAGIVGLPVLLLLHVHVLVL
jgi:hypothetical protein